MAGMFASSLGIGANPSWVFTSCRNRSIPFNFPSKYFCAVPCFSAVRYSKWRREPFYLYLSMSCFCSSSDSVSVSEDFHLVSTSECSDGSFMFRFGDASSIPELVEINEEKTEKPAAIVLAAMELENLNTVDELNMDCESESISKDLTDSLEVESKSSSSIGKSTLPAETHNFLNQMPVSVEENILCATSSLVSMASQASDLLMNQRTNTYEAISFHKRQGENVNQARDPGLFFERFKDPNITENEENGSSCHSSSEITARETVPNEQNVFEKDGNSEDIVEGDQNMVTHESKTSNDEPVLDGETNPSLLGASKDADRLESSNAELSSDCSCDLHKENDEIKTRLQSIYMDVGGNLKGEEIMADELVLLSGAASLSHPSKALAGGENAYFVVSNWLGVADGIGQWTFEGTEVGGFARDLMENCKRSILDSETDSIQNPAELITICARKTQSSGSTTVLVGYFDGQAFHVANIGDSGFFIIRDGAVVKKSSVMFHEFNFPIRIEKGGDPTTVMEEYKIDLDEGDVIVAATDALFDNLYEQEIVSILLKSVQDNLKPQDIAQVLAARAQEVGSSTTARSPFADAAQAAGYNVFTGGKPDNMAVIVSFVQKRGGVLL